MLVLAVGAGVACTSSSGSPASSFGAANGSDPSGAATTCSNPMTVPPDPRAAPPLAKRAIVFHVTNRSKDSRWVQTAGDDGCSPFDVLRGGAPIAVVPPRACACDCKAPEPRTVYRRLGPGETLDIRWDGVGQQLSEVCVTGQAFGCADGQIAMMPTSTPFALTALHYDIALHVEASAPPGCDEQPDGSWTCGANGIAPGAACAHGIGKVTALLSLESDAGSAAGATLDIRLD